MRGGTSAGGTPSWWYSKLNWSWSRRARVVFPLPSGPSKMMIKLVGGCWLLALDLRELLRQSGDLLGGVLPLLLRGLERLRSALRRQQRLLEVLDPLRVDLT